MSEEIEGERWRASARADMKGTVRDRTGMKKMVNE